MNVVLSTDKVSKSFYGRSGFLSRRGTITRALDNVTISIWRGGTLGVVGESGSGKSTLGRIALGLIAPDEGNVFVLGSRQLTGRGKQVRALRRKLGVVFQDPMASLDPAWSISRSISEPLLDHDQPLTRSELHERAGHMLVEVGLDPSFGDRYPHELSGGELQRVSIARALIADPEIVVCDEAVSSLDVSTQAQVIRLLSELQEKHGIAYLFISHDLAVVQAISDEVAVMHEGRVVESGPTRSVLSNPQHPYTRRLIAAIPRPDPRRRKMPSLGSRTLPKSPGLPFGIHKIAKEMR